jgi:hypothetical protein
LTFVEKIELLDEENGTIRMLNRLLRELRLLLLRVLLLDERSGGRGAGCGSGAGSGCVVFFAHFRQRHFAGAQQPLLGG